MHKKTTPYQEGNITKFPKTNIIEEGIHQVNSTLETKKEYFLKNITKNNILLYFLDNSKIRKIKIENWTITEKAIILKESKVIPLANILAVA